MTGTITFYLNNLINGRPFVSDFFHVACFAPCTTILFVLIPSYYNHFDGIYDLPFSFIIEFK